MKNNQDQNQTANVELGAFSEFQGGFEFRFTPTKRNGATTHYLHIFRGQQCLTPQWAGAFVDLNKGNWGSIIINDLLYKIPLQAVIRANFGTINSILYVKPGDVVKDMYGFQQIKGKTKKIWDRFGNC